MKSVKNKTNRIVIPKELSFILFVLALVFILLPAKADAATINVATGTSQVISDSICQLEEAIININDSARTHTDCVETGTYGTNDVINLPVGTINGFGSGSGFYIEESVKIIGQGRGVSILDNRGLYVYGGSSQSSNFALQDFTVSTNSASTGIYVQEAKDITLQRIGIESTEPLWTGLRVEDSETVSVVDSYIKGTLDMSGSGLGIEVISTNDNIANLNIERTTIDQVSNGIWLYAGSGSSLSVVNATIKNTTITGLGTSTPYDVSGSGFSIAAGITSLAIEQQGRINYTTINNTYSSSIPNNNASSILEISENGGQIYHTAQNDLYAVGNGNDSANYRRYSGSSGTPTFVTTSNGGNVSSDNSYSAHLNQNTDKHNLTSLASFLGVLQSNGGLVPTIALLEGSPAINSGTSVLGLDTDARGSARLQSSSLDAGAYESSFGGVAGDNNSLTPGVPNTGFRLLMNNPITVLITTFVCSIAIYLISRKYKFLKK